MHTPLAEATLATLDAPLRVVALDHADAAVAQQILAVHALGYAQEAALLQVERPAPLAETVEDIRAGTARYLGAMLQDSIAGILAFEPDEEPGQVLVTSLVVHPAHQRKGIARALLTQLFRMAPKTVFSVCVTAANAPALALYRSLGFVAYRSGTIGPAAIALLKLRRACP